MIFTKIIFLGFRDMLNALYNVGINLYTLCVRIAAVKNSKARLWVNGRKNLLPELKIAFENNTAPVAWFHCASLGEFEQARPVIETFKNTFRTYKILITFFSPSGYEIRKNYAIADYIYYLPADTSSNARAFLSITKPSVVLFTKYEFWYNYLKEIKTRKIPCVLFSSIFRKNQLFFKSYGALYKNILNYFDKIFVQDIISNELLLEHHISHSEIAGDTRFDRVYELASNKITNEIVAAFKGDNKLWVVGSSWPEDINILALTIIKTHGLKVVIAPHEIKDHILKNLEEATSLQTIRYSQATAENVKNARILIIDNIGMLATLYQYGDFAYIGGGFGKGIHNTLEAAAFGLPVLFGPNHKKFKEALDLINLGVGFSVSNNEDVQNKVDLLLKNTDLDILRKRTKHYVQSNTGATEKIINYCEKVLNK